MKLNTLSQKLISVAALLTFFFSISSYAEQSKIAVIDWPGAILLTEKAKAKIDELKGQEDFKEDETEFKNLMEEYKKIAEKYQKDRAVLSAEKREEEERRLLDRQQDLKYLEGKLQQSLQEFYKQIVAEQGSDAGTVLKNIIEEQKIGLLLRRGEPVLMHADGSFDITELVVERLNAIK